MRVAGRSFIRKVIVFGSVLLVLLLICVSFIQFYPFPKGRLWVQNRYPVVTQTASGKSGDPVNVLLIGDRATIQKAFNRAGWKVPDPVTPRSSAEIAVDSIMNKPYPTAPVSNLYLYHRKQDMAFERPTNTVRIRDHIRLWDTHTKLGNEEVWCGSATYDHGIELSSRTDMPTHHIAPNVDQERNVVYTALKPYLRFSIIAQFTRPNLFGFNGGGDWYYTDGEIAVLSAVDLTNMDIMPHNSRAIKIKNWLFRYLSKWGVSKE